MDKTLIKNAAAAVLAVLLIVVATYVGLQNRDHPEVQEIEVQAASESLDPEAKPSPLPTDPVDISVNGQPYLGNRDAPVEVIEFVDFQCPYCKQFAETIVSEMKSKYIETGKVRFIIKDFPLQIHVNAKNAAVAANCALDLGGNKKYFEYHDILFAKQDDWDIEATARDYFLGYASELGLNIKKFEKCYDNQDSIEDIEQDILHGQEHGINGTPIFFVNGMIYVGLPPTFEDMAAILDDVLSP